MLISTASAQSAPIQKPDTFVAIANFVGHPTHCVYFLGKERGEDLSIAYGRAVVAATSEQDVPVAKQLQQLELACKSK